MNSSALLLVRTVVKGWHSAIGPFYCGVKDGGLLLVHNHSVPESLHLADFIFEVWHVDLEHVEARVDNLQYIGLCQHPHTWVHIHRKELVTIK
jgi:hypothetical protein